MDRLWKILALNLIFAALSLHAEDAPKQDARKKAPRGRRIASIQEANQNSLKSTRGFQPNDGLEVKAGVSLGAGMQKETTSFSGNPSSQEYGAAPSVGIAVDLRYARYFGLEEDAYFQLAGSTPDLGGAKDSLNSMGSFTTAKLQYPFTLGSTRITPKGGVGFAYLKGTQKSESLTSTLDLSTTATGVYGMVGLEIEPMENLTIAGDYSKSVSSTVTQKNGTLDQPTDSSKFDRIRVGVLYRFMPRLHGGAQFIQRGVSHSSSTLTAGSNQDGASQLRQIQAVFQYEL